MHTQTLEGRRLYSATVLVVGEYPALRLHMNLGRGISYTGWVDVEGEAEHDLSRQLFRHGIQVSFTVAPLNTGTQRRTTVRLQAFQYASPEEVLIHG